MRFDLNETPFVRSVVLYFNLRLFLLKLRSGVSLEIKKKVTAVTNSIFERKIVDNRYSERLTNGTRI